jgi:hypothetical protein
MKIVITPGEMMDFVTSGKIPESAKETLAGGVLAMCNSPEMSRAIMTKVETEIRKVMADAIMVQSDGYYSSNKKSLKGWAAEIMLTELSNKVKELDIKSTIRTIVAEEVKKQFDTDLRINVRATISDEYKELLKAHADTYDIEHLVEIKVKKALAGILAK